MRRDYYIVLPCIISFITFYIFDSLSKSYTSDDLFMILVQRVTPVLAIILAVVMPIKIFWKAARKKLLRTIFLDTLFLSGTVAAASVILLERPVKDVFYYIGSLTVFAGILVGYLAIFQRFNLSCSRPIPDYHMRGNR